MVAPEDVNLAEPSDDGLTEEELGQIANKVIRDYENDLDSRAEWEEKHAKWLKIYHQVDEADDPPWDGASNESIPVLTEAVNQFQSRTYRAFFPNRYFIDAIPVGNPTPEGRERAERIAKHMSYQLGVLDRSYKLNKNQMFLSVALHGSDFTKTYFSKIKGRTIIERVRVQDLVVPYNVGPCRIEDLERKTHRKFMSINQTRILVAKGYFVDEGTPYSQYGDDNDEMNEVTDEVQGIIEDSYDKSESPALILEQHCLLDLDDDGIAEPYIVWVDYESRKVLRIQIRYEIDEFGAPINDKEPIEHFTHYQFLPNPDGFYGLGFGHLLAKLNLAINKLSRMFIDGAELSTVGNLTFLVSEALGLPGDEFELAMGKGIKIPRSVDDIRRHFMKMDFAGPSPELATMINLMQQVAERLSSSSDILSGQPDKVYQPMALLSMVEQGLQLFSSIQEFLGHAMEEELQKVYRINAKNLIEEEYFADGDKQITVTMEDYQDDFRVVPIFDPKYSTRSQKLAKAQAEYEFVLQNPLTSQNQQSIYLASRRYLESLDVENIEELLPKPEQPEVARIDDQNLENAYFVMPPEKRPLFDVFPDQDHINHIREIDEFIGFLNEAQPMDVTEALQATPDMGTDPQIARLVSSMSNDQKQELINNLLRHRSLHLSYYYGQTKGVMDEQGNSTAIDTGMGAAGGDEALLQDLMSALELGSEPPVM